MGQRKIFALTLAGKRVWSSVGDEVSESEVSSLTGLCTAVMGVCEQQGETIRSVSCGSGRIVCARRGELVFVAAGSSDCEAYLARELEYAYEAMLMALTSRVHKVLASSPGYDVKELLGSTGTVLSSLEAWGRTRPEPFLGAARAARLEASRRAQLAHVLASARKISGDLLVFGVALCGDAVLSVLQPTPTIERRLRSTDLLLLANYVRSQRAALVAAESSWLPLCLPRFDERGYFHAFVAYLDPAVDLCLVLVAADDKPETFATLRNVSKAIENALLRDGVLDALRDAAVEDYRAADRIAETAKADHFIFSRRRPLAAQPPKEPRAELALAQCLSARAVGTHHWAHYHALALRLRCGSAQPQHALATDPNTSAHDLFEAPLAASLVYATSNARTYFALTAPNFELYATFASLAPASDLAKRTHHILSLIKLEEPAFFFDPVSY
ncbi:hypothetical protein CTAYLR_003677 [Chrysophaeum taylorii]|uniref:Vacuolar fusion protein MON1 homolog n=1 Tax=Chrysophaeum taylorii TaxID=2483200 RepID=A0AAD7UDF8_9STRA|nr:hypothetical protein CTAYLR_003677 [Chrysophaeum taylorii]